MRKELYFTPETLQTKSQELLSSVAWARQRHPDIQFCPASAALLLLDLQKYFLNEKSHAFVPSALSVLPGIAKLAMAFVETGYPVITTRHLNTEEDAGMMAKWWRDIISPQNSYSHNVTSVKNIKTTVINKTQYDAFLNTMLEDTLHRRGIRQVVICGVMTHLCCETTARSAFMRGFEVFFPVDGTATYNEKLHRASLLTLSHGFALPVLIDELLQCMEPHET